MGQEIVYCFKCQTRIVGAEFAKGGAFQLGDRVCCATCATEVLHTLPPKEREQLLAQMFKATRERRSSGPSADLPAASAPATSSTGRMLTSSSSKMRAVAGGPPGGIERRKSGDTARRLWRERSRRQMALAGAAALGLTVVAILMLRSGGGAPPPPAPEAPLADKPAPVALPAATAPVNEEVRKARAFALDHPQDLEGQIAQWRGALLIVDTKAAETVHQELDRLLGLQKGAVAKALAELDQEANVPLEKEEFAAAAGLFQSARQRFSSPEWTLAIDRRIEKTRSEPAALLVGVLEKAADARRRGAAEEVAALEARVRRWQRADLLSEFTASPGAAPPAPTPAPVSAPAASKEVDPYRAVWEAALGRAAAGDLSGASQDLAAGMSGIPEGPKRAEAAEDLEALRRAATAVQEVRDALARAARGQRITLRRWNSLGAAEKVDGSVVGLEPGRILLRSDTGTTAAVDIGELTPSGLADQILARTPRKTGDDRTAAFLALIGGDPECAARTGAKFPDRWRDFSSRAAAASSGGRESEARRLYVEAEECAADPTRVATALQNYRSLLEDFATTAFVTRNKASFGAHSTLGKEYLLFTDMLRGTGTFKLAKAGKLDSAWLSDHDTDAGALTQNYVEFSFTALPDLEYRLWVYAGACCLETFAFGVQGTEMVLPSARPTAAEPGGAAWLPVHPSPPLKKAHAMHVGPKTPARWEWIPVPLPKYASPGVKTVRLLSDQKGFAVACASVSSLSTTAPREPEVRELQKLWSLKREAMIPPEAPTAGLVGDWPMADGSGTTAADVSGMSGPASVHGATWTNDHAGAGLRFDGQRTYLELPRTPTLDAINQGSYTLSAWYRPERFPPGKDTAFDAADGILIRSGMHGGLTYASNGSFGLTHWTIDPKDRSQGIWSGIGTKSFLPGAFYHVVGVVDRAAGTLSIYVNGRSESSGTIPPNAPAWSYPPDAWRVGIAHPNLEDYRWPAKGVIDEVRIYNRALGELEVAALYRTARRPRVPKPPASPAADGRPWRPIFDGKTADFANTVGPTAWVVKDGALAHVAGVDNALRTNESFGDGDLRVRYEAHGLSALWFAAHQTPQGDFMVSISRDAQAGLEGAHEIVLACRGNIVTAAFDGKPIPVEKRGESPSGPLQLNCNLEGTLTLRAVEFREAK